ncbi:hypothetical protein [Rhizohabitans arisaemae]|uniref:hypothetical protein n=1 Tax=Rhizohabitans arisaemae TaxID=2720610 RepID=UPI0024B1BB00|nr:hypothetical protein [Rhizohabitans arisaemae]
MSKPVSRRAALTGILFGSLAAAAVTLKPEASVAAAPTQTRGATVESWLLTTAKF